MKPKLGDVDDFSTPPKANLQKSEFVDSHATNKPSQMNKMPVGGGRFESDPLAMRGSDSIRSTAGTVTGRPSPSYPNAEYASKHK